MPRRAQVVLRAAETGLFVSRISTRVGLSTFKRSVSASNFATSARTPSSPHRFAHTRVMWKKLSPVSNCKASSTVLSPTR